MRDIMTKNPSFVTASALAADALSVMEEKKITVIPVLSRQGKAEGILHLHDLIQAGIAK